MPILHLLRRTLRPLLTLACALLLWTPVAPIAHATDNPADINALFDWAQKNYGNYFPGTYSAGNYQSYTYRYYPSTGNYMAVSNGGVYVMGADLTDGEVLFINSLASMLCSVYAPNCTAPTAPPSTAPYSKTGSVHTALKSWRAGTGEYLGTLSFYQHNKDGSQGALVNADTDACKVKIDDSGNLLSDTSPNDPVLGGHISYTYEDNNGATNTDGATRLKLFLTTKGNSYVEMVRDNALRIIDTGSELEMVCVLNKGIPTSRFPTLDGRLGSYAGNWNAVAPVDIITPASWAQYNGKTCSAVINTAGQLTATLAGKTLPVFSTTDLNMDQSIISTMFTADPRINPNSTYALEYNTSGFNGQFTLYLPPLTFYDSASPLVSSDTKLTCRTTKQ